MAQHSEAEREVYASRLESLSVTLQQAQRRAQEADRITKEQQATIRSMHTEDSEMRDCLATAEFKLSTSETRIADLTALVSSLKEELEQSGQTQAEMLDSAAYTGAQLSDLTKQIGEVECERNSLALQITHLQQDLQSAKAELAETEARYSTLQAQQLATMSSSQATWVLRQQIDELEQRVNRRTEQIGLHQHDIKRLETNLRLQDDRLLEMTGELEVAGAEKLAMIEDCKTTRGERDEALRRCEQLEEDMEELEARMSAVDDQRDTEVAALVGAAVEACSRRRLASRGFACAIARRDAMVQQEGNRAQEAELSAANALLVAEQNAASYHVTLSQLQDSRAETAQFQADSIVAGQSTTQATVALAAVLCDVRRISSNSEKAKEEQDSVQAELAEIKSQFELNLNDFAVLQTRYHDLLRTRDEENATIQALESRYEDLQQSFEALQKNHDTSLADLSRVQEELRTHIADSTDRLKEEDTLRAELDAAQHKFENEANDLRTELSSTVGDLEDARMQRASLESAHRQVLNDLTAVKEDLQQSLAEALERLQQSEGTESELQLLQDRHSAEVEALQEDLDIARRNLETVTKARDKLFAEQASTTKELEDNMRDAATVLQAKEDLEADLQTLRLQHAAELKSLEDRLDDAVQEKNSVESSLLELEGRYEEAVQQRDELDNQLRAIKTTLESLELEFKAASERHTRDFEAHIVELNATLEKQQEAEAMRSDLESKLIAFEARLLDSEEELMRAQSERDDAQTHATALQADIQRSLSLQRSHESRIEEW